MCKGEVGFILLWFQDVSVGDTVLAVTCAINAELRPLFLPLSPITYASGISTFSFTANQVCL